ncbi:signal peptide peptidase [Stylonychia lemnae]|uniref:Signal peptide peptidase n=1 Tax=Stylonychia lemnae TaxID=5949 RepID=A0A078A9H3_STYLE|nr:signal peptide peptidase [Stylonychia lemnae]|eukprot:CDW78511.1 signal peptide peptidase [Stylonychia lemnae]
MKYHSVPLLVIGLAISTLELTKQSEITLSSGNRFLAEYNPFTFFEVYAEVRPDPPAISNQQSSTNNGVEQKKAITEFQRISVMKDGKIMSDFDPEAKSQTCQPASKQMKNYKDQPNSFTKEKIISQDFVITVPKDKQALFSDQLLYIKAQSSSKLVRPNVGPSSIQLTKDQVTQEQRFDVSYSCDQLLQKQKQYYDTLLVTISSGTDQISFDFIVVCDANQLRGFDINFLVLFGIAVLVLVIVIKTPPLQMLGQMTQEEQEQTDLKLSSAIFFFCSASIMLFILYYFLDSVRGIFEILILVSCTGCASIILEELMFQIFKPRSSDFLKREVKLPCLGDASNASIIGTLIGMILSGAWYFTHNWLLNNLLAVMLALTFLKTIRLTTLMPGMLLLGLLFFYDIFWVFLSPYFTTGGKSVMVVVATGLDIPIKIVMPHLTSSYPTTACSLLGLGDILIPGIFVCFMARFGSEVAKSNAYFYSAIISYSIALLCCGVSLWVFKAAQPALLYIVPALYIAVLSTGYARGEIHKLKEGLPKIETAQLNIERDRYEGIDIEDNKKSRGDFEMTSVSRRN